MTEATNPRVLLIGLDAGEPRLVERWTADGTLPHLARLRAQGAYGRLSTSARWLVGSPWPTFYTGTSPSHHGFYHYLQWRPDRMAAIRPAPEWLPLRPFWRELGPHGRRVVAVDMPLVYEPDPYDGVEVLGWANHERLVHPATHPPELMRRVRERFGPSPYHDEETRPLPAQAVLAERDEILRATALVTDLGLELMERERWDLFLLTLSALHRGGHKLWDLGGVDGSVSEAERTELAGALREVYVACDAAVGRLVEGAGDDAVSLVFSLHGMGPNTSRAELLPEMLSRVLAGGCEPLEELEGAGGSGLAGRLRALVPGGWRHAVKRRLPLVLQDRLTTFWRMSGIDWSTTRAASLVADLQGYVRINLRGREARGVVEPGAEYDALCDEIAEGLMSFVGADSGEPVVEAVTRIDRVLDPGPRRDDLPDLVVLWSSRPAAADRAIVAPRYGEIAWPLSGKNPDGRSGNHRTQGFLVAAGGPVPSGSAVEGADILDLAPTAHALLRLPVPPEMCGRVLWASS